MRLLVLVALAACCVAVMPSVAAAQQPRTVWLCKPGKAANPCDMGLRTTRFSPTGERLGVDAVKRARRPRFDCFYVYPTVSGQPTPTASFAVDPELRSIARFQAARYSSDCRVFAPVYRQITLSALFGTTPATDADRRRAYQDVRRAWRTYLAKHNKGRGVVLIGHSQGTFMLRELVKREIDPEPRLRRRLISALLLGGNVLVKRGRDAGGDFRRVKACRSARQIGCVVAFSVYGAEPPADARFGRAPTPGTEVLCTNPAALAGGAGRITPVRPTEPFAPGSLLAVGIALTGMPQPPASTSWQSFPNSYRARCASSGGADVLRIDPLGGAPVLNPSPDPTWGLHLVDANIALDNLVRLVRRQAARWIDVRG